jgi:hypothetical protein
MRLAYPVIMASTAQENYPQTREEPSDSALESSLALKVMDYAHPREVVQDDRLAPSDKRAILSAWASDACAVESRPGFRWLRGTPGPVLVDHVLAALRTLDDMTGLHIPQRDIPVQRRPVWSGYRRLFAPFAERHSISTGASR